MGTDDAAIESGLGRPEVRAENDFLLKRRWRDGRFIRIGPAGDAESALVFGKEKRDIDLRERSGLWGEVSPVDEGNGTGNVPETLRGDGDNGGEGDELSLIASGISSEICDE